MTYLKYIIPVTLLGVCVVVVWMCGSVEGHANEPECGPEVNLVQQAMPTMHKASSVKRERAVNWTQPVSSPARTPTTLFDAIRQVESNGDDAAEGDNGRSLGPYQCGRAAWTDSGVKLDYDIHVWHRACTEKVMMAYWQRSSGCDA